MPIINIESSKMTKDKRELLVNGLTKPAKYWKSNLNQSLFL